MYLFDASSIIKACVERIPIKHNAFTIDLALYETFNAILMLVRRGILDEKAEDIVVSYLSRVLEEIDVVNLGSAELVEIFSTARKLNLTVYDTAYLYMAKKRGYILVTEDTELQEKAIQQGVKAVNLDELVKTETT